MRSRRLLSLSGVAVVVAGSLVVSSAGASVAVKKPRVRPAASLSPSGAESSKSVSVRAALDKAKATGVAVPVPALTDEVSTTVAQPSGLLTMELFAGPRRVQVSPGVFKALDLTMALEPDGRIRPAVSSIGLSFSGKGTGAALVSVPTPAGRVDLDWPWVLPLPTVSGDSVTYPNTLPGVDLVLRATPDGFSSLLVVKTKKGADQIAAVTPTLAVRGPARVLPASGGGLRLVTADGRVLLALRI